MAGDMLQMVAVLAGAPFLHVFTLASALDIVGDVYFAGAAQHPRLGCSGYELQNLNLGFLFLHKITFPPSGD